MYIVVVVVVVVVAVVVGYRICMVLLDLVRVCVHISVLDAMGRPAVVVEERARPASMERSSIVPSFAWMERLHSALACLALFPLLLSDMLPRAAMELGSYRNESWRTRMRFARVGGGSAVVCLWRIDQGMHGWTLGAQRPCTDGREGFPGFCAWMSRSSCWLYVAPSVPLISK